MEQKHINGNPWLNSSASGRFAGIRLAIVLWLSFSCAAIAGVPVTQPGLDECEAFGREIEKNGAAGRSVGVRNWLKVKS